MNDLADFNEQLLADIQGDAEALGLVTVEAFLKKLASC